MPICDSIVFSTRQEAMTITLRKINIGYSFKLTSNTGTIKSERMNSIHITPISTPE